VSASDDRHRAKEERRRAERRRRERLDALRRERDVEMRQLWERWRARIDRERER
jgi:hypothetical protein